MRSFEHRVIEFGDSRNQFTRSKTACAPSPCSQRSHQLRRLLFPHTTPAPPLASPPDAPFRRCSVAPSALSALLRCSVTSSSRPSPFPHTTTHHRLFLLRRVLDAAVHVVAAPVTFNGDAPFAPITLATAPVTLLTEPLPTVAFCCSHHHHHPPTPSPSRHAALASPPRCLPSPPARLCPPLPPTPTHAYLTIANPPPPTLAPRVHLPQPLSFKHPVSATPCPQIFLSRPRRGLGLLCRNRLLMVRFNAVASHRSRRSTSCKADSSRTSRQPTSCTSLLRACPPTRRNYDLARTSTPHRTTLPLSPPFSHPLSPHYAALCDHYAALYDRDADSLLPTSPTFGTRKPRRFSSTLPKSLFAHPPRVHTAPSIARCVSNDALNDERAPHAVFTSIKAVKTFSIDPPRPSPRPRPFQLEPASRYALLHRCLGNTHPPGRCSTAAVVCKDCTGALTPVLPFPHIINDVPLSIACFLSPFTLQATLFTAPPDPFAPSTLTPYSRSHLLVRLAPLSNSRHAHSLLPPNPRHLSPLAASRRRPEVDSLPVPKMEADRKVISLSRKSESEVDERRLDQIKQAKHKEFDRNRVCHAPLRRDPPLTTPPPSPSTRSISRPAPAASFTSTFVPLVTVSLLPPSPDQSRRLPPESAHATSRLTADVETRRDFPPYHSASFPSPGRTRHMF
ncbi:hypothetical protein R3P38DRAFT_3210445 [Favolaschia claudopus]|uniref:Uncharacterized protein n=1 Tax=Favolaschia claudopus TaxID=2862362 RepID=A0AAW0AGX4_9AGAR